MTHICPDHCRQFLGSLCVWYSKTNISRMPITQTDTLQVDLSTTKAAPQAGTEMLRKVAATQLTQTREYGRMLLVRWVAPRERHTQARRVPRQ